MKIAQLISTYLPNVGGAENCIHNVTLQLTAKGHKVTVIVPKREQHVDVSYKIKYMPMSYSRMVFRAPALAKERLITYFKSLQEEYKFDLWQITIGYPLAYIFSDFLKELKKDKIPAVLRCSGEDIQMQKDCKYGYRLDRKINERVKKVYPLFDACVANSPSMEDEYKALGIPKEKIRIIRNGFDFKRLYDFTADDYLRKKLDIKPEKKIILTVGRNTPKKNFQQIPAIIDELLKKRDDRKSDDRVDFAWVIVGRGLNAIKNISDIKNEYLYLHDEITDDFSSNPLLPPDRLIRCYKSADLFVFPSILEGLSSVIIEAMACGLPVVTTDAPGCRDALAGNGEGVLCAAGNTDDMAKSIDKLLNDESFRSNIIAKGSFISAIYDWKRIADRYEGLYQSLIN